MANRIDETKLEVICFCGSTKFIGVFRSEEKRLTMEGKVVLSVPLTKEEFGIEGDFEEKELLMAVHRRKILIADSIHVINVDGYIGKHTRSEIEFASKVGKPISYYERNIKRGHIEKSVWQKMMSEIS